MGKKVPLLSQKIKMLTLGFLTYNTLVYLIVGIFALLQATSSIGEYFCKRNNSIESIYAYGASTYGSTYIIDRERQTRSCISLLQNEVCSLLNDIKSNFTNKICSEDIETLNAYANGMTSIAEKNDRTPNLEDGIKSSIFNKPPPALA